MQFSHSQLLQMLLHHSVQNGEKCAVIAAGQSISYAGLMSQVRCAMAFLQGQGVGPGKRVALAADKSLDFIRFYLAVHGIGAVNVIIDTEANPQRLDYIEQVTLPVLALGYSSRNIERSFAYGNADADGESAVPSDTSLEAALTADLVFTTGTTGEPKGVCLSHANIYSSALQINAFIGNDEETVEVIALPLCHSFGLGRLRCNLIKGSTVVLLKNFANIKSFFMALETYQATGFAMVPAVWSYIRKVSGSRIGRYAEQIKFVEIGSSVMSLEDKQKLLELFPYTRICMHYGLTEASRSTFIEFHDTEHLTSIGRPACASVQLMIADENGHELPVENVGEICVKGDMVMASYYREEHNRNAFWRDYFRTGDLGYQAQDGYLYLVGREKEQINVGGKKVSPVEVEEALCRLGIPDCICVGVEDKSSILGEVVKAYMLRPSNLDMSFDYIKEALAQQLEMYKVPVEYEWVDSIPTTASGKKQRLSFKKQ